MPLKQDLLHKIPPHLHQQPHFLALCEYIKRHQIRDAEHLTNYLKQEIGLCEKWLQENKARGPTMVKSLRDKTVQLDVLKKCYGLAKEYL